jgi:mRNA-degrading endonuclease RelE of RelBE toxin-antitoxin system
MAKNTYEKNLERVKQAISELNKNRVYRSKELKKILMEKTGLSEPLITQYIPVLIRGGYLERIRMGYYRIC